MGLLDVVEAAYRPETTESVWLEGIAQELRSQLGEGLAMAAYSYQMSARQVPVVGTMVHLGDAHAARRALDAIPKVDPGMAARIFKSGFACGSLSQLLGPKFSKHPVIKRYLHANGIRDTVGISCRDVTGAGYVVCSARSRLERISAVDRRRYSLLSAHILAAARLRLQSPDLGLDLAEAVFSPGGKLLHAAAAAQGPVVRESLRLASVAFDRARSRRVRADADAALSLWRALVAGRWSLVDHFDHDGRRFLVARRNDPDVSRARLTLKECQAVAYAGLGHSNKLIGYYLGISPTSVASRLVTAIRKLGVRSRAQLIQVWAALSGSGGGGGGGNGNGGGDAPE